MKNSIIKDQQKIKAYDFKYSKPLYSGQTSKGTGFDVIMSQYKVDGKIIQQPVVKYYYPDYKTNTTNIVRKFFKSLDDLTIDLVDSLEPKNNLKKSAK